MAALNFFARIADAAAKAPGGPAIEVMRASGVETTTYQMLVDQSARVAAWLTGQGVAPGDRVAILADNDAPWIAAYLGVLRIGAVAVPLDTNYSAAQVRAITTDSGARVLFTTPKYLNTATEGVSGENRPSPGLSDSQGVPESKAARHDIFVALLSGQADDVPDPSHFPEAVSAPPPVDVALSDAAVILYTSGTTADPKGVVLTHGNLDAERIAALSIIDASGRDVILGVLPLFHALAQMANLLLPLSIGARVVFLETVSSTTMLGALQTRGVTIFACVPQFFYLIHQRVMTDVARGGRLSRALVRALIEINLRLRDHLRINPGRLAFARVHRAMGPAMRFLITGGSRFDPTIARDLYGMGFTLLNAYGLTETSGGATVVRPGDRFTTSVGQAFPGTDIKIAPRTRDATSDADDEGTTDGEVLIRGAIVMREYFRRPDANAESLKDGWLHTGDLGRLDEKGRLFITGRKKEIIVLSSGKNLYPEEIEAQYRKSAFIKEICVLGLSRPGEPSAERLHGVVVPNDAAMRERGAVNVRELLRFEIEGQAIHLPAHKRILSYDIVFEPLPRTTTGKLKRHEIERRVRERARTADDDTRPLSEDEQAWTSVAAHAPLVAVIATRLSKPIVRPDANLELDLGLDSMERVELLTALEQRQGTRVASDARATIFTVRQLVEAVITAAQAASAPGTSDVAGDADTAWDAVLRDAPAPELVANLSRKKFIRAAVLFAAIRSVAVIARLAPGFRVAGRESLPASGACILSANHQSYLDGFFLAAALPFGVFRRVFVVGAAEYFQSPFMAWLARAVNIVPVDPDANLVNAMQAGAAGLRLGKVLMLFPEGERSIDGLPKRFRKGAAILAAHTDAPIVPIGVSGLYAVWPRGRRFQWAALLPGRGRPIRLTFGAPVTVARGAYTEGTAVLESRVRNLYRGD